MTDENHDIPDHLIPDDDTVIAANAEEKRLNKELDTERWAYTEEPDDGECPYCGNEYERVSWASNVEDARKGVCPYDTSVSDFIVKFVHSYRDGDADGVRSVQCFCGPAHSDTLVTFPATADYDIRRI